MFKLESRWVCRQSAILAPNAKNLIDIGSDSDNYRIKIQPYIAAMYQELEQDGIRIKTLDIDPALAPDFVQDICQPLNFHDQFNIVLALNVLEHIEKDKIHMAINNLFRLTKPDGIVIVTVPYNLPRHDRPIDNMLRPTTRELKLLMGNDCLLCEQWQDEHYRKPYISHSGLAPKPIVTGGVFKKRA